MLKHTHSGVFKTKREVWAAWGNLGFLFHAALFFLALFLSEKCFPGCLKEFHQFEKFYSAR
jgi:hypothetical protein